jgi:hypothetical protein
MVYQRYLGSNGEYDSLVYLYYGNATPQMITFADGSRCLAVGCEEGLVKVYDIGTDINGSFTQETDYMVRDFVYTDYVKDWGAVTFPAVADLNNDGIQDMLIGNLRGGVHYVQGNAKKVGIYEKSVVSTFSVIPNPTSNSIRILAPSTELLSYKIVSLSGQVIAEGTLLSGDEITTVSDLQSGLYLVTLSDSNVQFAAQRLVVAK